MTESENVSNASDDGSDDTGFSESDAVGVSETALPAGRVQSPPNEERPKLPGYDLPVDDTEDEVLTYLVERVTKREIDMIVMMNEIMEKLDWHTKVFDETISQKWRVEAHEAGMTDEMVDWCISELRDKAEAFKVNGITRTLDIRGAIVRSDTAVESELRQQLIAQTEALRASMDADWHPGSNDQVLNLVHPSLYPLVYGRSRIAQTLGNEMTLDNCLSFTTKGTTIPAKQNPADLEGYQPYNNTTWKFSYNFQWLPCEVSVSAASTPTITSYINNLHPERHRPLYHTLEALIARAIPLWNACLDVPPESTHHKRVLCDEAEYDENYEVMYGRSDDLINKAIKELSQPEGPLFWLRKDEDFAEDELEGVEDFDKWFAETENDKNDVLEILWKQKRQLVLPDPDPYETSCKPWLNYTERVVRKKNPYSTAVGEPEAEPEPAASNACIVENHEATMQYTPIPYDPVDICKSNASKGLQVIIKIASIELSPENPDYKGGKWHLEGMANEHIAATALYYYDSDNVTESRLRFRQQAELDPSELHYEQNDHDGLETIYGLPEGGLRSEPSIQELGSVITKEGRMLAFRNTFQHLVTPFTLADPTKSGHRRFVALWLVDPGQRVISTKNVPPQQFDWWLDAVENTTAMSERLPPEISQMVVNEGKNKTMTMEEAKAYRLKLMEERTQHVDKTQVDWDENTYNFCEH